MTGPIPPALPAEKIWIDRLAQTLCFASRVNQASTACPMCDDHGRCQKNMWETFRPEAAAAWMMLKRHGMIVQPNKPFRLPGLGG